MSSVRNSWLAQWRKQWQNDGHSDIGRRRAALLASVLALLTTDKRAARRAAIVEVLADGRTHSAREILKAVRARLGPRCWARSPEQTLWADMRLLRRGGLRIGYSRRPGATGYFLYEPVLSGSGAAWPGRSSPQQVAAWRTWASGRKLQSMFAAWEFALDLARAGARSRHPDWTAAQIEIEARRVAGGVQPPDADGSR